MLLHPRVQLAWLVLCVGLVPAASVSAQLSAVTVNVEPDDIGLGGVVRPGTWTPLRLSLENHSASIRKVRCQWVLADIDGDRVQAYRSMVLNPQAKHKAWLYAVPPYNLPSSPDWYVQVLDEDSGELLASQKLPQPRLLVSPKHNLIGVTSSAELGLLRFSGNLTQHEQIKFIRGLDPRHLPDRWYGLSGLQALIWTPDSPDPSNPALEQPLKAIRRWVERGGHLVLVLPTSGEALWMHSALADMLPQVTLSAERDVPLPRRLASFDKQPLIEMKVLTPLGDTSNLFPDDEDRPWVVAGQFGFGRVTLIGVDLTSGQLGSRRIPDAPDLWRAVFGWRNYGLRSEFVEARDNGGTANNTDTIEMGAFVKPRVAMRDTFTGALMLAILVFGVYWLVAGPLGFFILRYRGKVEHAWVVFVALVLVFTAICWGGAMLLRPKQSRVAHFSVMDIDATSGRVNVHSWLSVFVARHGRVHVALDPNRKQGNRNTLVSAGMPNSDTDSVFGDPQRYDLAAASPYSVNVPFRATAKQFELDYLGPPGGTGSDPNDAGQWIMPQAEGLRIVDGFPTGRLSHGLPGTLYHVLMVYCPGDGEEPQVWAQGDWPRDQVLQIAPPSPDHRINKVFPLATKIEGRGQSRQDSPRWSGYLAERIRTNKPGQLWANNPDRRVKVGGNEVIVNSEVLTFFSMLPPPPYWDTRMRYTSMHFSRALGREFDLTALLKLRRLIVIGHLKDVPLPAPLFIDGRKVEGSGWTVVRWISPIS